MRNRNLPCNRQWLRRRRSVWLKIICRLLAPRRPQSCLQHRLRMEPDPAAESVLDRAAGLAWGMDLVSARGAVAGWAAECITWVAESLLPPRSQLPIRITPKKRVAPRNKALVSCGSLLIPRENLVIF